MITGTGPTNNSFTYTATGSNTSNANVNVERSTAPANYADSFTTSAFNNSNGSVNWAATPWVEAQDGTNTAGTGQIQIDVGGSNQLRFLEGDGATITRAVNLAGVPSATMTFTVDQNGLDAGETVAVQFDANGDGTFETVLSTIGSGSSSGGATTTVTLTGGTANSAIRFVSSAIVDAVGTEDVRIDNLSINFTVPSNNITAGSGDQILIGDANASTFDAGQGNDIVFAGGGNDTIIWEASGGNGPSDGRDFIDGGSNTATGDRFVIDGNNDAETYRIYTAAAAAAAGITGLRADTEIVVTRNGTDNASVIAELDNVEEITVNTFDVTANNGGGLTGGTNSGDTVAVFGDFTTTSLNYSTITVNGGAGSDTVDISGLEFRTPHRVQRRCR